jgi:hypothetical protein
VLFDGHVRSPRSSCLILFRLAPGLCCRGFRFLGRCVFFRVDFEEVIQDDEHHGGASEEDGERVELAVRYHLGCDGAFGGKGEMLELAMVRLVLQWCR